MGKLPDESDWSITDIERTEPVRSALLESGPKPEELDCALQKEADSAGSNRS